MLRFLELQNLIGPQNCFCMPSKDYRLLKGETLILVLGLVAEMDPSIEGLGDPVVEHPCIS